VGDLGEPPRPGGPRGQRRLPDAPEAGRQAPHGLSDREFDALFTTDKPVIVAYPEMADARLHARTRTRTHTRETGDDLPEIRDWAWPVN